MFQRALSGGGGSEWTVLNGVNASTFTNYTFSFAPKTLVFWYDYYSNNSHDMYVVEVDLTTSPYTAYQWYKNPNASSVDVSSILQVNGNTISIKSADNNIYNNRLWLLAGA